MYADVIQALGQPVGSDMALHSLLGVDEKELPRVCAALAGQAFLHHSSHLRRTTLVGGSLQRPLTDVRDASALRDLAVELRMAIYMERVAAKMREWRKVGQSM